MSDKKIEPFDSFTMLFKILIWAGFYKLLEKPKDKYIWICHQMYRLFAFLLVAVFNLQHFIFIIQRYDSLDDVFDCLMIEMPQLNLLVKCLNTNFQTSRIDKLNAVLKASMSRLDRGGTTASLKIDVKQYIVFLLLQCDDPMFSGNSEQDDKLLLKNNKNMNRLYNMINIGITLSGILWPISHYFRRYQDPNAIVPAYMPFETDTWFKYSISVFLQSGLLLWVGYGHISLDLLVSAYYAQAEVQLKIIKYNLEHLFNADNDVNANDNKFRYIDEMDVNLKERFVYYVQRFEMVARFTKEINEVFSPAMSFQFFSSTVTLCSAVYIMSFTPVGMPLLFMVFLLFLVLIQVFLYCYFGTLVNYESQSIVSSVYLSDWIFLSPKFRRLLLIAMSHWTRELTPLVSGLIPLSLSTFVSILKSAYSLYAVLATRN